VTKAAGAVLAAGVIAGCGGATPTAPVTAAAPQPAPRPAVAAAPNAVPTISGEDRCIGALGVDHVFELRLDDGDGDPVSWEAEADSDHGRLHATRGGPIAAGSSVTLVYSPPGGRPDENWITFTARDARGAEATKRLYVKNR
jgi:hypothetical protein